MDLSLMGQGSQDKDGIPWDAQEYAFVL